MTNNEFNIIQDYMLSQMRDSAHDRHHIDRVLYAALDIAAQEDDVDMDVLVAACLLHDIARELQAKDPSVCHAQAGGQMAFDYLMNLGWHQDKALHVEHCISSHRYRGDHHPQSIEAKILYDADKLDACGAMGIARTLIYAGQEGEALYRLNQAGRIITEFDSKEEGSFFEEFNFKLKNVYDAFYTKRASELAQKERQIATDFYQALYQQIDSQQNRGQAHIKNHLT